MSVSVHNIDPATLGDFTLRKVRRIPPLDRRDIARFWAKVHHGAHGACWFWNGSGVPDGHGYMGLGHRPHNQPYYAHRIAWTIANGDIPDGQVVMHSCDVPRCCNPDHLFLGTQGDNNRDAAAKGRLNVPRPNHTRRKLTETDVDRIKMMRTTGMTLAEIGKHFGVTKCCISLIVNGKRRVYTAPQLQSQSRKGAA